MFKIPLWFTFDIRFRNGRVSVLFAEFVRRDARHVAHLFISLTGAYAHGGIQSQCAVSGKACRIRPIFAVFTPVAHCFTLPDANCFMRRSNREAGRKHDRFGNESGSITIEGASLPVEAIHQVGP